MSSNPIAELPAIPLPEYLSDGIFAAVSAAKVRRLRMRLTLTGMALAGVVAYGVSAISSLLAELRTSAFFEYLRLLSSDSDIVLQNAKAYLTGALETIPVVSVMLLIAFVLLVLATVGFAQALYRSTHRQVPMVRI